jgi:hypothetical protein
MARDINRAAEEGYTVNEAQATLKSLATGRRKYDTRLVKAIVSRGDRPEVGTSRLVVGSLNGRLCSEDLTIRIIEDLGEYTHGAPYDPSHWSLHG